VGYGGGETSPNGGWPCHAPTAKITGTHEPPDSPLAHRQMPRLAATTRLAKHPLLTAQDGTGGVGMSSIQQESRKYSDPTRHFHPVFTSSQIRRNPVTAEIFAKIFLPRFSRFWVFHPIVKTFFHCKTQTHQISLKRHVIQSTSRAKRLKCSSFFVVFFVAQLCE